MKQEAILRIKDFQKDVSRGRMGKIWLYEDKGGRYMQGNRTRIVWELIEEITVPYEARPKFNVGQKLESLYSEKEVAVILDRSMEAETDRFYYTIEREGVEQELAESYVHSDWVLIK